MLTFDEYEALPYGKGVVIAGACNHLAMYVGKSGDGEFARFISDNGTLLRFRVKNYDKTWHIERTI